MAQNDNSLSTKRDKESLTSRGLSLNIPKPNILRIELLDGKSRQRYLGGIQRVGDEFKNKTYENIVSKEERTFFGFLTKSSTPNTSVSASWSKKGGTTETLTNVIKPILPKTFVDVASNAVNAAQLLTGTSVSHTGSGSVKKYQGASFGDFSLTCEWYMPEQFNLCVKSLQILHRMAYPLQINDQDWSKYLSEITKVVLNDANEKGEETSDPNVVTTAGSVAKSAIIDNIAGLVGKITETGRNLLGFNLTFDPLPVRVSVGQYFDYEPLVITGFKLEFSKENFIIEEPPKGSDIALSPDITTEGRHVPISCGVTISFKNWLNPAPKLEFLSLFGHEMFGQNGASKVDNSRG